MRARLASLPLASFAQRTALGVTRALLMCALVSCSSDDTPKAWNALATCIAGKDAASPIAVRVQKLRLIQLGNAIGDAATAKDAWPKRCNGYADELFATLPTSGETALLRSKMTEKLHCNENKGSCTLPTDGSLLSTTTELWDAAKSGGLTTEVAANVPPVNAAPEPLLDAKSWKPLSTQAVKISGPVLTSDGRGVLVMKAPEGRSRPSACEFSDHFAKVRCIQSNPSVPELPTQSIEVVSDPKGLFAAGLTEDGLVAYDLQSGQKSEVRGTSRHLLRDGLVVEKGAKDDLTQAPPPGLPGQAPKGGKGGKASAKAKPKATVKEEGYIAVELNAGKASKEIKLPIKATVGDPIAIGNQIAFMNPVENGAELGTLSVTHGRVKVGPSIKGAFSGALHSCQQGGDFAVATFGPHAGQNNAKATAGDGKTQFTAVLFRNNAWSKALEATLPFDRSFESDLVCGKDGASLVWIRNAEGGAQVGRVDCNPDGCKSTESKLPNVESKWWWGAGPLGDKVFLFWRAALGETRLRVGSLAELATAKDVLVFDSPDFNGPTAAEVSSLLTPEAALFVFRNEQPVALRVANDGALRVVAP
jgi:hypothetical protein